MASGDAIGDPKRLRLDTDREVGEGDWLWEKSVRTECGERWWVVLAARLIVPRSLLAKGCTLRYSLLAQERQAPTSADPSIPADFPTEPGLTRGFVRHYRARRR